VVIVGALGVMMVVMEAFLLVHMGVVVIGLWRNVVV
jgi:hypothetical protein